MDRYAAPAAADANLEVLQRRNAELSARVVQLSRELHKLEALSQLAASTVHDTRNALQVIIGHLDLLAPSVEGTPARDSAHAIRMATEHAAMLCRDLIALAGRDDAPRTQVEGANFLVVCERVIRGLTRSRFECTFEAEPGLWPVEVEQHQFLAAIVNLAANARDAMPDGGRLALSARNVGAEEAPANLPPGDYVAFRLEDTGCGMTPEVLARAREPFFTTKTGERGTGLGLPMVEAFARRSNGELELLSAPGAGTRAELLLPRSVRGAPLAEAGDYLHERIAGLRQRVGTPWLREALDAWTVACPRGGLPHWRQLEAALSEHEHQLLVVAPGRSEESPPMQLVRVGSALAESPELLWAPDGPRRESEALPPFFDSCRRALRVRSPVYERVSCTTRDGTHAILERLIMPASEDGRTGSRLYGTIVIAFPTPERT